MVFRVLDVVATAGSGADVHFFLDFRLKEPYILITLRSQDRKSDVRENQSMKNATKKAAKPKKKAAAKKKK